MHSVELYYTYRHGHITVFHVPIHVSIEDALVAGLAGGVQCQAKPIRVGRAVETIEMELIISTVHNVATVSAKGGTNNTMLTKCACKYNMLGWEFP